MTGDQKERVCLREFVSGSQRQGRIDRKNGVINGVKILGTNSRNNRRYPIETLQQAVSLYENAKVNLNHPEGDPSLPRQYQDRFGVVRNVRVVEAEGLFADFHFNPKHPLAEQLLWDAEHVPENVGFSHNIEADVVQEHDTLVVKNIITVRSVDLVADPATTQGLFESVEKTSDIIKQVAAEEATQNAAIAENESLKQRLIMTEQLCRNLIGLFAKQQPVLCNVFNEMFLQSVFEEQNVLLFEKLVMERFVLVESLLQQHGTEEKNLTPISREQYSPLKQTEDAKTFVEKICQ